MKYLIFITAFLTILIPSRAQEMIQLKTVQPIASSSFLTLKKLVNKDNYRTLGFEKMDEVDSAYLGDPIQLFMIRLDKLKDYKSGDMPHSLLDDCETIIYPVLVDEQVRSSIEIEKADGTWKPSKFGSVNLARMLNTIRSRISDRTKIDIPSIFTVEVPALNQIFIAYNLDDELMFVPILDDPGFGFISGVSIPAAKVFEILLPAAKAHDGLPG